MITLLKLICLLLGTAATVLYIILTLRGQKYDSLLENLPDEGFSDKALWAAGYALQETSWFSINSPVGNKLMGEARLLHPENEAKYAEYWARLYWARTLSLSILVLAVVLCFTAIMDSIMVVMTPAVGLVAVYAVYSEGARSMQKELAKRSEECLMEFSNVVSKLALLISSGMILTRAWRVVAESKQGTIYDLMKASCEEMDNGASSSDAIYNFGVRSSSPEIRKFSSILIQSISKSGADLPIFMIQQSNELWSHKRQMLLQKGDEAAAKLLIPTMLMLIGILLIIIVSALAGLSLSL